MHMKPQVCWCPLLLYQKIHISYALPYSHEKKKNGFFIVVNTLVATKWLLMLGKFETKARILAMRLAFARLLASFTTISKNPFFALYKKKRTSFA